MTDKRDFKQMRHSPDPSTREAGEANLFFWNENKPELGPLLARMIKDAPTVEDRAKFEDWLRVLEENCEP